MDGDAIAVGKQLEAEDSRFHIHHAPFSDMANVLKKLPGRARAANFRGSIVMIHVCITTLSACFAHAKTESREEVESYDCLFLFIGAASE